MWRFLEQYFHFSQIEKRSILALLTFIVLLLIIPSAYRYYSSRYQPQLIKTDTAVAAFLQHYEQQLLKEQAADTQTVFNPYEYGNSYTKKDRYAGIKYFVFDPNTIGKEEWKQLGFSEKQAAIIERYKQSGGRFRTAEDLKRVFVIGEEGYNRLKPYVNITIAEKPAEPAEKKKWTPPVLPPIDLNTADSAYFELQRGIGPSLARRIINYRQRLGGFVSVQQLKEVWNFPDSLYKQLEPRLTISAVPPVQLNINTDTKEQMGRHPYINYKLAGIIVAYREQHGPYKKVDDLLQIPLMTDSMLQKIKPYVVP